MTSASAEARAGRQVYAFDVGRAMMENEIRAEGSKPSTSSKVSTLLQIESYILQS